MEKIKKTLGIDLGSNSLGWAVVDSVAGTILNQGVVIFDEGIVRVKGADTLETPASVRRAARMGRRLKFRRRLRKFHLLRTLIEEGMCPLSAEALKAWKDKGVYPLGETKFREWVSSTKDRNPYRDRALAATEPVDPMTLGRALYHLAQRRGFLSSRKEERGKDEDNKESGVVKGEIAELTRRIREMGDDCTLGQYFYRCFQTDPRNRPREDRIRGRHTGRKEHYLTEYDKIAEVQNLASAKRIVDGKETTLADIFRKELFHQRPLRSQKRFVGNCPLEPQNPRCMTMRPEFEEFRMLSFVNNLRILDDPASEKGRPLTSDERAAAIDCLYVVKSYRKAEEVAKAIGKAIGLKKGKSVPLNYKPFKSVSTCSVCQQLNNLLGTQGDGYRAWRHPGTGKSGKPTEYDYRTIVDALAFFQDDDLLRDFGKRKLGFSDEQAEALCKIRFADGYANYSLHAIEKILPFLREGYDLHHALQFAKLPEIVGKARFEASKEKILGDINALYDDVRDNREAARRNRNVQVVPLERRIRDYLHNEWDVSEDTAKGGYSTSSLGEYKDCSETGILPPVELGMIRNPLVQRSMTILRRLVNQLRRSGKIDADTRIHIELARSVNDRATRLAWEAWQKKREDENGKFREKLREAMKARGIGGEPSDDLVLRWRLAEEQEWKCLYTGRTIGQADIFTGFDIEHTVPRSMSGDDGQANKTLCDPDFNRKVKKGMLPSQCPGYVEILARIRPWKETIERLDKDFATQKQAARSIPVSNPDAKSKARIKALATKHELDYWKRKVRYFEATPESLGDIQSFAARQLVDTGIMCRHAVEFLGSVYRRADGRPNVWPVSGAATAFARKEWKVQDSDSPKVRDNHVHHAIDAIVIAELSRDRFNRICSVLKDDGAAPIRGLEPVVEPPFPNFGQAVHDAVDGILVRHLSFHKEMRQTNRKAWPLPKSMPVRGGRISEVPTHGDTVRGALHADTFYGRVHLPGAEDGTTVYVVRKPLVGLQINDAVALSEKIVDPAIRAIVSKRLEELSASGAKVVNSGDVRMPSGVPVNKVRIRAANVTEPLCLKKQTNQSKNDYKNMYYVNSTDGSNFRMALFQVNGKSSVELENLLDWAQHHKEENYKPCSGKPGFRGYLRPGSLVLLYENTPDELRELPVVDLKKRLYKTIKFQKSGQTLFRYHSESRASTILQAALAATPGKHKNGESSPNYITPHELLLLSPSTYLKHMLFEGIDFNMSIDGEISFIR